MKKSLEKDYDNHVFENINVDKIKEINEHLHEIGERLSDLEYKELYGSKLTQFKPRIMNSMKKIEKLEEYIFLLDDVLDDRALKGFYSYLADYVMKC